MIVQSIYLNNDYVEKESWNNLINYICKYNGSFRKFKIVIEIINNKIKYYLVTKNKIPVSINSLNDFLIKEENVSIEIDYLKKIPTIIDIEKNVLEIYDLYKLKKNRCLNYIIINITPCHNKRMINTYLYYTINNKYYRRKLLFARPSYLLSIDFNNNKRFYHDKKNKYLNLEKTLPLFNSSKGIFEIDCFPYLSSPLYLNYNDYDFFKHSLIIGSSGTGKSKLISLLTKNILENNNDEYKVVIIDPHASLEKELGGIDKTKVIDFFYDKVNIFSNSDEDIIIKSELLLSIFNNLMRDMYNAKLERVLRYTFYLLFTKKDFSFSNIKKVILNLEYRNNLINELSSNLNDNVTSFFLTEFNSLKNNYYDECISPIISFLDELLLFTQFDDNDNNIINTINNNNLTIFSLNRNFMGDKVLKMLSSLIMEQILESAMSYKFDNKILLVIDEVSLLENPVMLRFLAEARKFNIALILTEQYFNQISYNLQTAINANVINYYCFRTSRSDASILKENFKIDFNIKVPDDDKINLLTGLSNREVVVRVCKDGKLLPVFKASTNYFEGAPIIRNIKKKGNIILNNVSNIEFSFLNKSSTRMKDILSKLSNSRKGSSHER